MYLVAQHGQCRSRETGKIKLFPLPNGVKIMFISQAGKATPYNALYNMKASSVYSRKGSFVPDLLLGADYSITQPVLGHTWKMNVPENKFTGPGVSISNLQLTRQPLFKTTEQLMSSSFTPRVKKILMKTLHHTTLSRVVAKLGAGTYVVASCRGEPERRITRSVTRARNARTRVTGSINTHGGNLKKVLREFPNLNNRVSLVVPIRGQERV
jgi:hypothetical protein